MFSRRDFIRNSGLSFLPAVLPAVPALANGNKHAPTDKRINFVSDSEGMDAGAYIKKLQEIQETHAIEADVYGNGGVVEALQKKFQEITGKEKAIFMPTGTMANQLALAVLSGDKTKIFVQETSHVYRDEADAAQSVFNKRLIPLAKGVAGFTAGELRDAFDYHMQGEVFKSGMGAVCIENPVRRANGQYIELEEIRKVSAWCRQNSLKLHLDGARIYLASAYTGVSIREYSSYFDTVYISLYKYFNAAGGAILCGSADVIDKMTHLIKVHGGTMYQFWPQAAMALHYLEGFEDRYKQAVTKAADLFRSLNALDEIKISAIPSGTNIFETRFSDKISTKKFSETLAQKHNIIVSGFLRDGIGRIMVNESVRFRDNKELLAAFKDALTTARQ
jgi:threonine aldolase